MSRYNLESYSNYMYCNDNSWSQFCDTIKTSCHFKLPRQLSLQDKKRYISKDCITISYYIKDDFYYFHISNEDRRLIHKYLNETNYY